MKYIKPILKFLGIALIGFVLAGLLLPFVFKDKIIKYLKEDINANLNATLAFGDIDLSLFKSFPDMRLSIDSIEIKGVDDFDGIVLYKADRTSFDINLKSLFGKNLIPQVNSIQLIHPEINVVVLDSAKVNYLIMKDTTESEESKFALQLKHYQLINGRITYQDNTMPIYMVIDSLDHSGSGDFTQDIFDLKTTSKAKKLFVKYDGMNYVNNVAIDLVAGINLNFPESKYTLKDNVLKFNELNLKGDGFIQMKDEEIVMDFEFKTASEDFKSFLSIVPGAYTKDFEQVKTSGKAAISGKISGSYSEVLQQLPVFDILINIDNGAFKYPALPQDIKNLNANVNIKTTRPDYKDLTVNIPAFKMNIGNDAVSGRLLVNNLTGNQQLDGQLKGRLDLNNLAKAFPIQDLEILNGIIHCDLVFNANMSDINAERYEAIRFEGGANAQNIRIKMKSQPLISIGEAKATASPQAIAFSSANMTLGKSDLAISADVRNPLAFFSTEKGMKINVKANSNLLDLDEWMTEAAPATQTNDELTAVPLSDDFIKKSNMNVDFKANTVKMNGFTLKPVNMDANLAANAMELRNFNTSIEGSDIALSGIVVNAYDYLFNNRVLDGSISLKSNKLDLNKFMTDVSSQSSSAPLSVIAVPERVRLKIDAQVKELTYTNLSLRDANGSLDIRDHEVAINDFVTKILGGTLGFKGLYNTEDLSKPVYSIKLDMNKIKYGDAFTTFDMMKKVAPIAEYLDGFFNTSLVMKGVLGQNMMPVLNTIDASGLIETLNGTIKGINPMSNLSSLLGIKELNNIDLVNTRNWFEIVNGYVEIKEFSKHIKGIDMTMAGKHGINQDMEYNIDLVIPRQLLQGNKVTATAESGLKMLESEASKLGINIDQGPNLFVNVKMTGNLKNPKFKITPKSSKGVTIEDQIKDKSQEVLHKAKDSVQNEIKRQQDKLKDTISKTVNKELDKAKSKVEEKGKQVVDTIKSKVQKEVVTKIDSITKGIINDSLKQKGKEVIEKGAGAEIDKIKDKLKDFNPFKNKKKD